MLSLAACDCSTHTRCTALHSWVNLAHEFNYCVGRKPFLSEHPVTIYINIIQWSAEAHGAVLRSDL